MSLVATYDDLVAFLTAEQAPFRHDPAAQVVQISIRSAPLEGFCYLRWERQLPYIQIILPIITDVPADRAGEVIDALARVNHAIALPGFGYDFAKNFVYFRLTVAYEKEGVAGSLLRRMILSAVSNGRDFLTPLRAISAPGGEPGSRILDIVVAGVATAAGADKPADKPDDGPASSFNE